MQLVCSALACTASPRYRSLIDTTGDGEHTKPNKATRTAQVRVTRLSLQGRIHHAHERASASGAAPAASEPELRLKRIHPVVPRPAHAHLIQRPVPQCG